MYQPSIYRTVPTLAGFILSICGLFWLLMLLDKPDALVSRIGYGSAILCLLGVFITCWGAIFAFLVRKLGWSPRSCGMAGLVLWIPAIYFYVVSSKSGSWSIGSLFISTSWAAGYVCRRFAFRQLTDEELSAPHPPPSLFHK